MRIKKGFKLRKMCGENIITADGMENINFNKLVSLNATAAFLWEQVSGTEFNAESLAELLVKEYGIDIETAKADAENLCKAWIDAGVAES